VGNMDRRVVEEFGDEWARFDQRGAPSAELERIFGEYFSEFPWASLPPDPRGFDLGCGSGRWARLVAPRVGTLHCVDAAAEALAVARRNLAAQPNCEFHHASVDELPFADGSMDFGYSLGVLHHVPQTAAGIADCVRKLRPGAPFLVYLYYAFDQRPWWFKLIWRASDLLRRAVAVLPPAPKAAVTNVIAAVVYWPLARLALLVEKAGRDVDAFPLSAYRDKSFYTMKTDARDRFGTRLEQRFTRQQIAAMMTAAGLERIRFREGVPYWCAVAFRTAT
jgi:ubiquinone/menaquinone biosynthesis C-methylase UbiE